MDKYEWSTADIMMGKMFVGGIPLAKSCPGCHSSNIRTNDKNGNQTLRCDDCHAIYGGASARA